MPSTQLNLPDLPVLSPDPSEPGGSDWSSEALHQSLSAEHRGEVYTRPEVVAFMLDLAGYLADTRLSALRVLEPAAGDGAFAREIVTRLIQSFLRQGGNPAAAFAQLRHCLVAVEVFAPNAHALRAELAATARRAGLDDDTSHRLAAAWVIIGDFLQITLADDFDLVVGNPPYVRQESIPEPLLAQYRRRFATLYNRADLYVLFFERGLHLLKPGGRLAFICSDRWMKCAYGKPLRSLVAAHFHLDAFVDMVDTPAFTREVIAYPAITVISRPSRPSLKTLVAFRPSLSPKHLERLAAGFAAGQASPDLGIQELHGVATGEAPWLIAAGDTLPLVRALEARLPLLEAAGCKVGIGVATGCDRVFIDDYETLDVEPERKVRLVMADCIRSGRLVWSGQGLVNPFEPDGTLADPARYPRFARFLQHHEAALRHRHIARRAGTGWYRTIDRVWSHLPATPKLLIPDIKGAPNVVIDRGEYYPHHNLYWITSSAWGLEELQAVLRSTLARLFVATYCVKMSGGFLRFQAQYLRRIRLPLWTTVPPAQRSALRAAVARLDQEAIDAATVAVYRLDQSGIDALQRFRLSPTPSSHAPDYSIISTRKCAPPSKPFGGRKPPPCAPNKDRKNRTPAVAAPSPVAGTWPPSPP